MLDFSLYLSLGVFLYLLFHGLLGGEYPEIDTFKKLILKIGLPFTVAIAVFIVASPILLSPVSGLLMAVLGWVMPGWISEGMKFNRLKDNRKHSQNLATTAGTLFGGGMVTSQAFKYLGQKYPDPFGAEFREMNTRKSLDPYISYPDMLEEMADKYELHEMRAMAKIISAADQSGGNASTSRGLKRLAKAIRLRNELIHERIEGTQEPKWAVIISLSIIGLGIFLDVTIWRKYFINGGQLVLAFSCLMFVIVALAGRKFTKLNDIK